MIGISGLARSGKDTLAKNLSKIIEEDFDIKVKIYSFALPIRCQLNSLLKDYYHISPFTEKSDEKLIIRPMLVTHGEQMKKRFGKDFWLKELMGAIEEDRLEDKKIFPIISDVRFDFEAEEVKTKNGQVIHISKIGNTPPNKIEAKNDPLVRECSNLKHSWPAYDLDKIHECKYHAQILWQMLKHNKEDEWKKIYC